jgi:hypothetical protein
MRSLRPMRGETAAVLLMTVEHCDRFANVHDRPRRKWPTSPFLSNERHQLKPDGSGGGCAMPPAASGGRWRSAPLVPVIFIAVRGREQLIPKVRAKNVVKFKRLRGQVRLAIGRPSWCCPLYSKG